MDVLHFARELRVELQEKITELDKFIAMGEALLREAELRKSQSAPAAAMRPAPVDAHPEPVAARQPEPIPLPDPSMSLPDLAVSMYQGLVDKEAFSHMLRNERARRHAQTKVPARDSTAAMDRTTSATATG